MAIGCIDAGLSYLKLEKMDINGPTFAECKNLAGEVKSTKAHF